MHQLLNACSLVSQGFDWVEPGGLPDHDDKPSTSFILRDLARLTDEIAHLPDRGRLSSDRLDIGNGQCRSTARAASRATGRNGVLQNNHEVGAKPRNLLSNISPLAERVY